MSIQTISLASFQGISIDASGHAPANLRSGAEDAPTPTKQKSVHTGSAQQFDDVTLSTGQPPGKLTPALAILAKNYPPFPAGSEDRKNYLKNLISLRHQIEQLTIPREPTDSLGALKISDKDVAQVSSGIGYALSALPVGISASGDSFLRSLP